MNLSELPQIMIDSYFSYQNKNSQLKSTWNKNFEIINSSDYPYFRFLIKDDKFIYKIFYDNLKDFELQQYNIIETFNYAINQNFFENIALIDKLISFENKYIGYVYPICEKVEHLFSIQRTTGKMKYLNQQPEEFITLYSKLKTNILETKIGYTDLYPSNIVKKDNQMYIIDLDSITNLNKISIKKFQKRYGNLPEYYIKFINKILYKNCKND